MFAVKESWTVREARIAALISADPRLAVVLAVINVEWTLRRACIALGQSPNITIRAKLRSCHGLPQYKALWQSEVYVRTQQRLPEVIHDWQALQRAFRLRHLLVHGVQAAAPQHAAKRAQWALAAAYDLHTYCRDQGVDLDQRLPIRRHLPETA